jgi:hypothetical protein
MSHTYEIPSAALALHFGGVRPLWRPWWRRWRWYLPWP